MNFKNTFEQRLFDSASRVCGKNVSIEHNKVITIEVATAPEVAAFSGPPKKEIDVITAGFQEDPDIKVLISAKDYESKAEPADVQEWAAVVKTMGTYSAGTKYLGLILCSSGFTSGCEPWAACHNIGLIPPLKGKQLAFETGTVVQMYERVLGALAKRMYFPHDDLFEAPEFYEFVYRLVEPFEGRDAAAGQSKNRYRLLGTGWLSSFGELVRMLKGKTLQSLCITTTGIYIKFSDGLAFRMIGTQLQFGTDDGDIQGEPTLIDYEKNFLGETCSFDFIKELVIGQQVTSAGDWGDRFEFGLTDDLILAVEPDRLQVYRTRNPVEENLL